MKRFSSTPGETSRICLAEISFPNKKTCFYEVEGNDRLKIRPCNPRHLTAACQRVCLLNGPCPISHAGPQEWQEWRKPSKRLVHSAHSALAALADYIPIFVHCGPTFGRTHDLNNSKIPSLCIRICIHTDVYIYICVCVDVILYIYMCVYVHYVMFCPVHYMTSKT